MVTKCHCNICEIICHLIFCRRNSNTQELNYRDHTQDRSRSRSRSKDKRNRSKDRSRRQGIYFYFNFGEIHFLRNQGARRNWGDKWTLKIVFNRYYCGSKKTFVAVIWTLWKILSKYFWTSWSTYLNCRHRAATAVYLAINTTNISIFDSYDMKRLWFKFGYDIFSVFKMPTHVWFMSFQQGIDWRI